MTDQHYSKLNLYFMLYKVLDVLSLTNHPYFAAHDLESCNMVIDTAEGIAEKYLRPFFKESDKLQPVLINGEVKVHQALAEYCKIFCDSGLMAASFDENMVGSNCQKPCMPLLILLWGMHIMVSKCLLLYLTVQQHC
jgi:hypothetical protein